MDQVETLKMKLEAQARIIAEMETLQKAETEMQKAKMDAKKVKAREYMKVYTAAHIEERREVQRLYARRVRAAKKIAQETTKVTKVAETAIEATKAVADTA